MNSRILLALGGSVASLASGPVMAGVTPQADVTVTLTINNSCSVNVGANILPFPTQTATASSGNVDGSVVIGLTCSGASPVAALYVDNGIHTAAGSPDQRRMLHKTIANTFVPYDLYVDSARTSGGKLIPSAAAVTIPGGIAGPPTPSTVTIYGRIPAGTALTTAGDYDDVAKFQVTY